MKTIKMFGLGAVTLLMLTTVIPACSAIMLPGHEVIRSVRYWYDMDGRLIEKVVYTKSGIYHTTYEYDDDGHLIYEETWKE